MRFRDATRLNFWKSPNKEWALKLVWEKKKCVENKWEPLECVTITRRVSPAHQSVPETYNDVTFHGSAFSASWEEGEMWTNLSLFQATEFWSMKCKELAMHVPQGLANRILLSGKVIIINQHWWNPGTRVQMLKVFLGCSTTRKGAGWNVLL
jgi:hypothetical protein